MVVEAEAWQAPSRMRYLWGFERLLSWLLSTHGDDGLRRSTLCSAIQGFRSKYLLDYRSASVTSSAHSGKDTTHKAQLLLIACPAASDFERI